MAETTAASGAALRTPVSLGSALSDVVALGKPSITAMSAIVAAGAMLLAPGNITAADAIWSLVGICFAVSGAGALNMLLERDVDALMARTAKRPLPAGRLHPLWAAVVGLGLAGASLPILWLHAGALSASLTLFSLFVYVLVYTPMKRTSPWALVVGAVPGAMPALMGSAAVSHRFDAAGTALFAFVFLWQIPHFTAIAIYREREYARAGHRVVSSAWGQRKSVVLVVVSTLLLSAAALLLAPLKVGGVITEIAAVLLGIWFVALTFRGFVLNNTDAWARRVFLASLVYQTAIFGALALDALIARFH